jgi:hypothetical protein
LKKYRKVIEDYICNYHNEIIKKANELLNDPEDSKKIIEEILILTNHAFVAGQKMEKRLKIYKEGIESLGFKRDRRLKSKMKIS